MVPAKFSELVASLAVSAVVAQRNLNREFELASQRTLASLASLPPELSALLSCPPVRVSVDLVNIDTAVIISVERTTGFGLRAVPVHAGYCVRYQTQMAARTRVQVRVEQVPVTKGASSNGDCQQAHSGSE